MSLMLDREYAPEAEYAEKEGFGRTAGRVLLLSLVVTALVAGLYMAFGGNSGTDPLAGVPANQAAATDATKPAAPAKPKPLTYEQKAAALAAKLPKNAASGTKRSALIAYSKQVGIKITAADSPATAATQVCGFLAKGTATSTLVNEFARGSGYDKKHTRAFLLGATSLYCPSYAKNFR